MSKWYLHEDCLYNLSKFIQICRRNDNEIVLSTHLHNEYWNDESKSRSLLFLDKEEREEEFEIIINILLGD